MGAYFRGLFGDYFVKKDSSDIQSLERASKSGTFDRAYQKRKKEIESLRQYDRGEKDIIAPDLGRFV